MVVQDKKNGIDFLRQLAWGSHVCVFYGTPNDLEDILVPYFQAGLLNNEFCLWITSDTPVKTSGEAGINPKMPDFADYLETGQLEFISHNDIYLQDGIFHKKKALRSLFKKYNQAIEQGYDGMRVGGCMPWLENGDCLELNEYENIVNNTIGNAKTMTLCAYPLDKCTASDFIDIMNTHKYAIDKHHGNFTLLGNHAYPAASPGVSPE